MISSTLPAGQDRHGYSGLLNLEAQRHWTVFLSDFALPPAAVLRLRRQLENSPTRPLFLRIDRGIDAVKRKLRSEGVDPRSDYLSFHGIVARHPSVARLHELFAGSPRGDLARLDLPLPECGFSPRLAAHLIRLVTQADYVEQDRVSSRFFHLLRKCLPYRVSIRTADGVLEIADDSSWFELAGRLRDGETRTLPGGEVAYTGDRINGTFVVDGAILATPETPAAANDALRLTRVSRELAKEPLQLRICAGRVVKVEGGSRATRIVAALLDSDERYGVVTEVGISFNRACDRFIHGWAASSNEGRPGVHVGIGGDPDTREESEDERRPLVHLDLMTANCEVSVNDYPFLQASS